MPTDQHPIHDHCSVCHKEIFTMAFKGTGVCGEQCRKRRDRVIEGVRALTP